MANDLIQVIRGGRVLHAHTASAPLADVLVQGSRIIEVGAPGMHAPAHARLIDASGMLLHPGLINAHTHGHGNLAKGFGERWTLELLLAASTWSVGGQTAEDRYEATLLGAAEMLLKGCTACYDLTVEVPGPTVEGLVAVGRAYEEAGMRAVVAPMVSNIGFFDAIPGLAQAVTEAGGPPASFTGPSDEAQLSQLREALRLWPHDRSRVQLALAPTIAHHCTDGFLVACARLAREHGTRLHSHVQESQLQAVVCQSRYGHSQVRQLQTLGLLGPDFTAAHGVWLDAQDMAMLGAHGCSVAHNPGSNMRLGNGLADVRAMLDAGIVVALGTDGAHCSDNLNMYESMRLASMVSSVQGRPTERWLGSQDVITAATTSGAYALGFEPQLGRVAPGYEADLVFLDLGHVNWLPLNDARNQLVHTEDGNAVHSVMVGGRLVVQNRRLLTLDMQALARRVEAARTRLAERAHHKRGLFTTLRPIVDCFCSDLASSAPLATQRLLRSDDLH